MILDFGSKDKDDVNDLKQGHGKTYSKISDTVAQLKEAGEISENAQVIIVLVKEQ